MAPTQTNITATTLPRKQNAMLCHDSPSCLFRRYPRLPPALLSRMNPLLSNSPLYLALAQGCVMLTGLGTSCTSRYWHPQLLTPTGLAVLNPPCPTRPTYPWKKKWSPTGSLLCPSISEQELLQPVFPLVPRILFVLPCGWCVSSVEVPTLLQQR